MPIIPRNFFTTTNNTVYCKENKVINNNSLSNYGKLLENIKSIENTYLDLSVDNKNENKSISVDVAKLSKDLLSKILELYTPQKISSHRIDIKNQEKSKEILDSGYNKVDENILNWWENEKTIFPSSIINRTIDKLYVDEKMATNRKFKKYIFFLLSSGFNLNLDIKAAQSTIIQHIQDIPEVVKIINELGASNNSSLKYDIYCLLAENIYNFLSGNKNEVDFLKIKEAIKNIAQRKNYTSQDELPHSSFYPTFTLAFCGK